MKCSLSLTTVVAVCVCVTSVVSAQLPERVRFQPGSYGFGGTPYRSAPVQFATAGGNDYVLMNDMAYQSWWGHLVPVPNTYGPLAVRAPSFVATYYHPSYHTSYHASYHAASYPVTDVISSSPPCGCDGGGTPHVHAATPSVVRSNTTVKPTVAPAKSVVPAVPTPAKRVIPQRSTPLVDVTETRVGGTPTQAPAEAPKILDAPVIPTATDSNSPFEILPPADETITAQSLPPLVSQDVQDEIQEEVVPTPEPPTPATDSSDPFGNLF